MPVPLIRKVNFNFTFPKRRSLQIKFQIYCAEDVKVAESREVAELVNKDDCPEVVIREPSIKDQEEQDDGRKY